MKSTPVFYCSVFFSKYQIPIKMICFLLFKESTLKSQREWREVFLFCHDKVGLSGMVGNLLPVAGVDDRACMCLGTAPRPYTF